MYQFAITGLYQQVLGGRKIESDRKDWGVNFE